MAEQRLVVVRRGLGQGLPRVHHLDRRVLAFLEAGFDQPQGFLRGREVLALRVREFFGRLQRPYRLADFAQGLFFGVLQGDFQLAQPRAFLDQSPAAIETVEQRQAELHARLPFVAPVVPRGLVRVGIGPGLRHVARHLGPIAALRRRQAFALQAQGVFGHGQVGPARQRGPRRVGERHLFGHQRNFVHQFRGAFGRSAHQAVQRGIGQILIVPRLQRLRAEVGDLHLRAQLVVVRSHALPPAGPGVFQLPFGGGQRLFVHRQQMFAEHGLVIGADRFALDRFRRRADGRFRPLVVEPGRPQRRPDPAVEQGLGQPQSRAGLVLEARGDEFAGRRGRAQFLVPPHVAAGQRQIRQRFGVRGLDAAARDFPPDAFLLQRTVVALRQRHGFPQQQRSGQIGAAVGRGLLGQIRQPPVRGFRADGAHLRRIRHACAPRQQCRGRGRPPTRRRSFEHALCHPESSRPARAKGYRRRNNADMFAGNGPGLKPIMPPAGPG